MIRCPEAGVSGQIVSNHTADRRILHLGVEIRHTGGALQLAQKCINGSDG